MATSLSSQEREKTKELVEVSNEKLIPKIISIKQNPDLSNWYKLITRTLQVQGYYINHKKVYRLMKAYHLTRLSC